MGTFCDYNGNMAIPDEFKDEFNENMIKILQRGGMMQFENVHMYGKEIHLIRPVECDEEGKAYFLLITLRTTYGKVRYSIPGRKS